MPAEALGDLQGGPPGLQSTPREARRVPGGPTMERKAGDTLGQGHHWQPPKGGRTEGDTAALKTGHRRRGARRCDTRGRPEREVAPQDQPICNGWSARATAAVLSIVMVCLQKVKTILGRR